jgi:hypothetical protein
VAVSLEGHPPEASETHSERWVSSITLPAILKWVPVAAAIGVPLSYLWGHAYAVGYASYFGIPGDFVKVGRKPRSNLFFCS